MCATRIARNNVVPYTFFYRPIYYNQRNERRENISTFKHIRTREASFERFANVGHEDHRNPLRSVFSASLY